MSLVQYSANAGPGDDYYGRIAAKNINDLNDHTQNINEISTTSVNAMKNILAALRSIKYNEKALQYSSVTNLSRVNAMSLNIINNRNVFRSRITAMTANVKARELEILADLNAMKKNINNVGSLQILVSIRTELQNTTATLKKMKEGIVRPTQNLSRIAGLLQSTTSASVTTAHIITDSPMIMFLKIDNLIAFGLSATEIENAWIHIYLPKIANVLRQEYSTKSFEKTKYDKVTGLINRKIVYADTVTTRGFVTPPTSGGYTLVTYTNQDHVDDLKIAVKNRAVGLILNDFILTYKHKIMALSTSVTGTAPYIELLKKYSFPIVPPPPPIPATQTLQVVKLSKPTVLMGIANNVAYTAHGDYCYQLNGGSFNIVNTNNKNIHVTDYTETGSGMSIKRKNDYEDEIQIKYARGAACDYGAEDGGQKAAEVYQQCINHMNINRRLIQEIASVDTGKFVSSVINFESTVNIINESRSLFPSGEEPMWFVTADNIRHSKYRLDLLQSHALERGLPYDTVKHQTYYDILTDLEDKMDEVKLSNTSRGSLANQVPCLTEFLLPAKFAEKMIKDIEHSVKAAINMDDLPLRLLKKNNGATTNTSYDSRIKYTQNGSIHCANFNVTPPNLVDLHYAKKFQTEMNVLNFKIDLYDRYLAIVNMIKISNLDTIFWAFRHPPTTLPNIFNEIDTIAITNARKTPSVHTTYVGSINGNNWLSHGYAFIYSSTGLIEMERNGTAVGGYYIAIAIAFKQSCRSFIECFKTLLENGTVMTLFQRPCCKYIPIIVTSDAFETKIGSGVYDFTYDELKDAVTRVDILNTSTQIAGLIRFQETIKDIISSPGTPSVVGFNITDTDVPIYSFDEAKTDKLISIIEDAKTNYMTVRTAALTTHTPRDFYLSSSYSVIEEATSSFEFLYSKGLDLYMRAPKPLEIKAWGPSGAGKSHTLYGKKMPNGDDVKGIIHSLLDTVPASTKLHFMIYDWYTTAFPFIESFKHAIKKPLIINYHVDSAGDIVTDLRENFKLASFKVVDGDRCRAFDFRTKLEVARQGQGVIRRTTLNPGGSSRAFLFFLGRPENGVETNYKILNDPPGQENPYNVYEFTTTHPTPTTTDDPPGSTLPPVALYDKWQANGYHKCAFLNPLSVFFNKWYPPMAILSKVLENFRSDRAVTALTPVLPVTAVTPMATPLALCYEFCTGIASKNYIDGNMPKLLASAKIYLNSMWTTTIGELMSRLDTVSDVQSKVSTYINGVTLADLARIQISIAQPDVEYVASGEYMKCFGISTTSITLRDFLNKSLDTHYSSGTGLVDILSNPTLGDLLYNKDIPATDHVVPSYMDWGIDTANPKSTLTMVKKSNSGTGVVFTDTVNITNNASLSNTLKYEKITKGLKTNNTLMVTYQNLSTLVLSCVFYAALFENPAFDDTPYCKLIQSYLLLFVDSRKDRTIINTMYESVIINDIVLSNIRSSGRVVNEADLLDYKLKTELAALSKIKSGSTVTKFSELIYDTCLTYADIDMGHSLDPLINYTWPRSRYFKDLIPGKDNTHLAARGGVYDMPPNPSGTTPELLPYTTSENSHNDFFSDKIAKSVISFSPIMYKCCENNIGTLRMFYKAHGLNSSHYPVDSYNWESMFLKMEVFHGYSNTKFLAPESEIRSIIYTDPYTNSTTSTAPYISPDKIKKIDIIILNQHKTDIGNGISNYIDICTSSECKLSI